MIKKIMILFWGAAAVLNGAALAEVTVEECI